MFTHSSRKKKYNIVVPFFIIFYYYYLSVVGPHLGNEQTLLHLKIKYMAKCLGQQFR